MVVVTLRPRNRERAMAAKTLIVARKVWVSKGLSNPVVNRRMGWTKSRVGSIMTSGLIEAEQRNSISGFVGGCCCGRE